MEHWNPMKAEVIHAPEDSPDNKAKRPAVIGLMLVKHEAQGQETAEDYVVKDATPDGHPVDEQTCCRHIGEELD